MSNRNTKQALLKSVLALVLCFSMLIGSTFAWFTDSVSSGSNVITAGNLDIKVEYTLDGENWDDLDGATDLFQKGLWEPGHTEVVALRITNAGTLALKYVANMNIISETVGKTKEGADIVLSDILTVSTLVRETADSGDSATKLAFESENGVTYENTTTFKTGNILRENVQMLPGDVHYVIIKVDMAEIVGNEANHNGTDVPSINFGINVLATQYTHENDSFGKDYDENADYKGNISVQIIPFGSEAERLAAHMKLREKDLNYSGRSTYMNLDGVDCLKLDYHSYSSLKPYRCTPCFTEEGCVDTDHCWVRVTYMTDYELPGTITIQNSANGNQRMAVVEDTSASKGEWVTSAPVDISGTGIIEGALSLKEKDVLVYFSAQAEGVNIYLKEIAFFESEEDAYEYYGDEPDTTSTPYRVLTYDTNGTAIKKDSYAGNKNDYVEFDEALGIANLKEADGTAFMNQSEYYMDLMFDLGHIYNASYKYMRVLYSAKNPEGVDSVSMTLFNNGNGYDNMTIQEAVTNTDGFVLSETVELKDTLATRFENAAPNRLTFDTMLSGGEYKVKAVYFFKTQEAADALTFDNDHTLTIKGTDISQYKIIVAKDCDEADLNQAKLISARIFDLTGHVVEILTDDTAETEYEIVIGQTNRAVSDALYGTGGIYNATSSDYDFDGYQATLVGNKLVFASGMKAGLEELVANYLSVYLYNNKIEIPDAIELTDESVLTGNYGSMGTQTWPDAENVQNPEQFTDDFGEDEGYWTEESGEDNWSLVASGVVNYLALTYGEGGNSNKLNNTTDEEGAITAIQSNNYSTTLLFADPKPTTLGKYVRVVYSAKNPEGAENVSITMMNNANGNDKVTFESGIMDTNGYVLSETVEISDTLAARFGTWTVALNFNTTGEGGEYKVKQVLFFNTKEEADAASLNVRVPNDYSTALVYGAGGNSNKLNNTTDEEGAITATQSNNYTATLLFADPKPTTVGKYVRVLYSAKNPEGAENVSITMRNNANGNDFVTFESGIVDTDGYVLSEVAEISDTLAARFGTWTVALNFNTSGEGGEYKVKEVYFYDTKEAAEAAGKAIMSIDTNVSDGYYSSNIADNAVSYLHVYEKNVSFAADMMCVTAEEDAKMGMLLRYTAKDAYVKAGYDFEAGVWYVENREGADFECYRIASVPATVNVGELYNVKAVIDNKNLTLYVNGTEVLTTNLITQVTPGRIGLYANNAQVNVDNADVLLLSGMGKIIPNVVHSELPSDVYMEGGTVWELQDGTLVYEHWSGTTFRSSDNGKTWVPSTTWTYVHGCYPNILRLENDDFIKVIHENVDNVYSEVVYRSSDDGATWTRVGVISPVAHPTMSADAGNMNDKLTQMSDGRIFYGQNYQGGGRVFCRIWYSDNNGETWIESETTTYEMDGNEDATFFGECKIMECADGTLRMYCSWNDYGHIVYSESIDNGETWGPLQHMNDFVCSRSSMQFMKDPYADNDTTYYMVWCYGEVGRTRLALAKTTDGVNWEYLGDVWRWENNYTHNGMLVSHLVDPFITVTEDYLIIGTGLSEETDDATYQSHQKQRQHIWSIKKDTLTAYEELPDAY